MQWDFSCFNDISMGLNDFFYSVLCYLIDFGHWVNTLIFSFLQESYVWKMYQERCWEFFPAGDCFRKQYEDQLN
jgi:hypothetical protein